MGRKKTPFEWAYEHTENLKEKKEEIQALNIEKNITEYINGLEKSDYTVGYWTLLKNISLAYCVNPFGKILDNNDITNTVCLDLFSGCGITPMKDPDRESIEWTVGSPLITTLMTDYPFKKYYFCDNNCKSIELLEEILNQLCLKSKYDINYNTFPTDANRCMAKLCDEIKGKYVFAFIDPTGFQWNWESMESLFNLSRFDIIMNFQTSLVDRIPLEKEEKFFGPCASDIRDCNTREEKLSCYISQIEKYGLHVSKIKIGKNETDQYYYHLLHISRKKSYKNIISTLKDKIERFHGDSIKKVWNDLYGYSRQSTLNIN